jgi:hypothetical protein
LCLTVIGLIKIYTGFEKIRTLADSFLEFVSIGFLVAAVLSYLARSAKKSSPPMKLAPLADLLFLVSLTLTAAVAMFMTFALAG